MVKRKHFGKKFASFALAGIIGLSTLTSATPLTVHAAKTSEKGRLTLKVYDSSVYGADRTMNNLNTSMLKSASELGTKALRDYWSDNLTNYDFLRCPEGLSTFRQRKVLAFDITIETQNGDGSTTLTVHPSDDFGGNVNGYYSYDYLKNDLKLTANPIIIKGGEAVIDQSQSANSVTWLVDGHTYVLVEDPDNGSNQSGYKPNTETGTKHGWQAKFTWEGNNITLGYDASVKPESGIQPLHNEVMRAGIMFNVMDKDLLSFNSQGYGEIEDSMFAIYNISTPQDEGIQHMIDGSSPVGYVVADRNNNGSIDSDESLEYIPSYTETDVIAAYETYLAKNLENGDTNGDVKNKDFLIDDEFIIGKNSAGKPIVPVMTLKPDKNGLVKTSSIALPVGNYLILQVQAGKGYYIDEDFRPIVSVGSWSASDGSQYTGFGRGYYDRIDDVAGLTPGMNTGSTFHMTSSPVAFVPTGTTTQLSDIKVGNNNCFYVDNTGYLHLKNGNPGNYGPLYGTNSNGAANGKYIVNSKDARMKPIAGQSKFNAYNAIVRAGVKTYIADADDLNDAAVNKDYTQYNIYKNGNYIIVPQGNGSLEGAKFTLKNISPNKVKLYNSGTIVNPGDKTGYVYTVKNNALIIPADDLPFGMYEINQTSYGEGYEEGDFKQVKMGVGAEDKITIEYSDMSDEGREAHRVNGVMYLPNQIINGGEIYSLMSNTAPADSAITLSVYNISDQYVYVDKNGDGEKERYETNLTAYTSQIAGKGLTHEQLVKIVNKWTACSVQTVAVDQKVSVTDSLPYGDYLVVVTSIPDGYVLTSEYMTVDKIESDDDNITFTGCIEDVDAIPVIDTVLEDAETFIDSIAVKERVFLQDRVSIINLEGGKKYDLYGVIADAETGDLLQPGAIGFTTVTAYTSTNTQTDSSVTSTAVYMLIQEGVACTTPDDNYVAWINEVKNYATAISNETLVRYCDRALSDIYVNSQFEENKLLIMGTLKYLAGGIDDTSLDGTTDTTMLFNYIDTRKMEGKTLVAYQYICSHNNGAPITDAINATNTGELLAALETTLLGTHKNVTDEDQTVRIPTLDITAKASYTGVKTIDPSETVKATVVYGNVEIGNDYTMEVKLYDEFGNPVKEIKDGKETGNDYVLKETFHTYDVTGELEFVFEDLDVAKFNDQRLTAYATLYRHAKDATNKEVDYWLIEKGDADSMGYDITDETPGQNQVDVIAPTIKTVLADQYGDKVVDFDAKVTLVDTVTYKNLIVGGKYESVLTLVNSEGFALLDDDGNPLTATVTFTAKETEQVVTPTITFNGKDIQGIDIIAFNDLYRITNSHKALVAQEHNVNASDQTIEATGESFKIVISTVALDNISHTHVVPATDSASITDNVEVRNLEPKTKYIVVTEMAYAENGAVVTQIAPVETEIITDENGRVRFDVPVSFNATVFQGQKLVVFQTIYNGNKETVIAEHKNKNDANQTVMIPAIDTVATADDGTSKLIVPKMIEKNLTNDPNSKKVTLYTTEIMDTVTYTNFIPGNVYKVTTEILSRDGKGSLGVTETEWVPTTANGTMTTFSEVDVTNYIGSKLVVAQTITDAYSGTEIIIHKDLTDEDQTVEIVGDSDGDTIPDPIDPDPSKPSDPDDPDDGVDIQTGVVENYGLLFALAVLLLGSATVVGVVYARKRKTN